METIKGSCQCGKVTYEVHPPFSTFRYCFCPRCRKATGSSHASNLVADPTQFSWLTGEKHVKRYDLPEARSFSVCFCLECGSPLPHATRSGREIIIPAGSVDVEFGQVPVERLHFDSRANWYKNPEDIIDDKS